MQVRVLCLGFLQDGDVGTGDFPESEEVFVGGKRPDAGRIGIRSLQSSRLQDVGTSHTQMCQRRREINRFGRSLKHLVNALAELADFHEFGLALQREFHSDSAAAMDA
jgi:hypothetical protein